MPPEIRIETQRTGFTMTLGKQRMVSECEVTIVTDLRDTPWGVYDFGVTTRGPTRWVRDSTPD